MAYTRLKRGLGNDSHISIVVCVGVENKVQPKPRSQREGKKATVELELEAPARWRGLATRDRETLKGPELPRVAGMIQGKRDR